MAHPKGKASPAPAAAPAVSLDDKSLFINRELSLLGFQRRVLEEAMDPSNPLLERVKFLSILGSNLDEFFMVRVAGLKHQVDAGLAELGPDGLSAAAQLDAIRPVVAQLMIDARNCLHEHLIPSLAAEGIEFASIEDLDETTRLRLHEYFLEKVYPVLTPLAFDPGRPFPHISNLSLNLAILIRGTEGENHFARLKVPDTLPQLIPLEPNGRQRKVRGQRFIWLEQLIVAHLNELFPGMEVLEAHPFHVTRDADVAIQELEADDLLETIEESVRLRRFGDVVRVKVNQEMPDQILEILVSNLEADWSDVYRVQDPLSFVRLKHLLQVDRRDLRDKPFVPRIPPALDPKLNEDASIFSVIRRGDILLHHPFDSFDPVVDLLRKAARDPAVLAIKMTLYRVGRNSPVVDCLLEANERGKQVAVLVELKARFDEESNIEWARRLEAQGVHVVYGLLGLKIHSKLALVVRKEGDKIRRYAHFGTGNYNVVTAGLYTDLSLLTCDEDLGADATDLFNHLTGYSAKKSYRKLLVAPVDLFERTKALIEREIEHQRAGRGGHIIFKMNALAHQGIIKLLYRASQAGVKIDLFIRGACSLRVGVPGVSETITVRSLVGRFLEHSRIYYFRNGGAHDLFLGSADMMPRNLHRRVETLFPIEDKRLIRYIRETILDTYLEDEAKVRLMQSDGTYLRNPRRDAADAINAQARFLKAR
ncbi:MAG: polyphosphate kinase 1 [Acidobacteria bacterium]|nr:polyphosphate kinase 1 [Acidobacteriota bacterium]